MFRNHLNVIISGQQPKPLLFMSTFCMLLPEWGLLFTEVLPAPPTREGAYPRVTPGSPLGLTQGGVWLLGQLRAELWILKYSHQFSTSNSLCWPWQWSTCFLCFLSSAGAEFSLFCSLLPPLIQFFLGQDATSEVCRENEPIFHSELGLMNFFEALCPLTKSQVQM